MAAGRHYRLGEALAGRGYAVYAYDLRGHGLSSGARGQIGRFSEYLDDSWSYLDVVRAQQPGRPLYLLGHSLGGLISAAFVERNADGLDGLILSSPFLRLAMEVPGLKRIGATLLSVVWPDRDIGNPLQAADLSREPDVIEAYITDPLVHHIAPARWVAETFAAQDAALAAAPCVTLPLLQLYGDEDAIADPAASREFFAAASSADKTPRCYEGFYHELFNEIGRETVFTDLAAWLEGHAPAAAAPAA